MEQLNTSEFRLVAEVIPGAGPQSLGTSRPAETVSVYVPPGPSRLVLGENNQVRCEPARADEIADDLIMEPLFNPKRHPQLFVLVPSHADARINGQPAPRLALLKEKDVFTCGRHVILHVTLYHHASLGSPRPELIGKECPVCRVPFTAETTVFACSCGAALHHEASDPQGLKCATMRGDCPSCGRPIVLEAGYTWQPRLDDEE